MVKTRAEMMELVGRLLAEYAEFQRGHLCPKAICWTCREKNWRSSAQNFSARGRLKQTILIQRCRGLCSIESACSNN